MTPETRQSKITADALRDMANDYLELEAENRRLRELLNNAWLVVNDPANSFLAAGPWSRAVVEELDVIRGCMRPARLIR